MLQKTKKLYEKYKEIINYLIVGGLTTVISLITYYICVFTIFNPNTATELQIANIISWIASVTFAYFSNRRYVFEMQNKNMLYEAIKFYTSRLSTLFMDMAIMFVGVTIFSLNDKIVKLFVQIVVIIANYLLSKLFVFRNKM